jgi:hypothetical protein
MEGKCNAEDVKLVASYSESKAYEDQMEDDAKLG